MLHEVGETDETFLLHFPKRFKEMEDINYEVYRNNDNEPDEYCSTLEDAIYYVNSHNHQFHIVKVTREVVWG